MTAAGRRWQMAASVAAIVVGVAMLVFCAAVIVPAARNGGRPAVTPSPMPPPPVSAPDAGVRPSPVPSTAGRP